MAQGNENNALKIRPLPLEEILYRLFFGERQYNTRSLPRETSSFIHNIVEDDIPPLRPSLGSLRGKI